MSAYEDEDPKKPHEPFHPKKGGTTPYEEDDEPWRHCREDERDARRHV